MNGVAILFKTNKMTIWSILGLGNIQDLSLNHLTELRSVKANTFAPLKKLKILRLSNNDKLIEIDRQAFGEGQIIQEVRKNV